MKFLALEGLHEYAAVIIPGEWEEKSLYTEKEINIHNFNSL